MSSTTHIQWTDASWSPVTGCTRVSEGCRHCYAEQLTATRLSKHPKYAGLAVMTPGGPRWTGEVRCHDNQLEIPLRWRKARKIFVCDMSDLFHKDVPFEFIDRAFAVMALCPQHQFQLLTKRPERMAEYFDYPINASRIAYAAGRIAGESGNTALMEFGDTLTKQWAEVGNAAMPLPNVWIGTSCEDQAAFNERVPHLLRCPASIRFLSLEPLLSEINIQWAIEGFACDECADWGEVGGVSCPHHQGETYELRSAALTAAAFDLRPTGAGSPVAVDDLIHWVIVGGESGSKARPCNAKWIANIVEQCKAAGVACFVKQLGSHAIEGGDFAAKTGPMSGLGLRHSKGGDPAEWPEHLRVREWPKP